MTTEPTPAQAGALDALAQQRLHDHMWKKYGVGLSPQSLSELAEFITTLTARDPAPQAPADAGEAVALLREFRDYVLDHPNAQGLSLHDQNRIWTRVADCLEHPAPAHAVGEWVWVPREPTREMLVAEDGAIPSEDSENDAFAWGRASWDAMIAAAPPPPAGDDVPCSTHPDAPHGFDRSASHCADRYVCECEGWTPPDEQPATPADAGVVAAFRRWYPEGGHSDWYDGAVDADLLRALQSQEAKVTGRVEFAYATPQPPAPARVEVDDTMVERACAAYSALSCKPFTQHHPQKMRAALTAALAPQADLAGGEVGRG